MCDDDKIINREIDRLVPSLLHLLAVILRMTFDLSLSLSGRSKVIHGIIACGGRSLGTHLYIIISNNYVVVFFSLQ